ISAIRTKQQIHRRLPEARNRSWVNVMGIIAGAFSSKNLNTLKNQSVNLANLFKSAAYHFRMQRSQSKIMCYNHSYSRGFNSLYVHFSANPPNDCREQPSPGRARSTPIAQACPLT